ncbi:MAG: stage V sporulation protein AD [Bacilli bacterium]|nr:stage V sporulation protein AD [Bacilli bacterium]
MTFKYDNVYINETATITGPYEKKGPLQSHFDKSYDDLYFGTKTWEQAEEKLVEESIDMVLAKMKKTRFDVDVHIGGDLLNQMVATSYAAARLAIPYLGVYTACATSVEALIIGSNMIEAHQIKNCVCSASSHNNAAEKQFRYPVEYGGPKPKTATFTTTGGASAYLSYNKKGIKIESATIGTVQDLGIKDAFHMGAVMAPAAADTIYKHLRATKREADYYDLIVTGDLGQYGKQILKEYMQTEYGIHLKKYDDTACMIFDKDNKATYAGGSGPACAPLVTYGYLFDKMHEGEYQKILLVATGALHSATMVGQKLSIPSIANAISLEVIE